MEVWKDIILNGIDHRYQISTDGRVKALAKKIVQSNGNSYMYPEIIMKPWLNTDDYYYIHFYSRKNNVSIYKAIHVLKAEAFIENPFNKPWVNHKDGDKQNNALDNLEWSTPAENHKHAIETGLTTSIFGESNFHSKLTEEQVIEIRATHTSHTKRGLARKYNVEPCTIRDVINNRSWASDRSFKKSKLLTK